MSMFIIFCLVVVGLVNLVLVLGVFLGFKMEKAYDVCIVSKDLEILMCYWVLLFGVLGGFIIYVAFFLIYYVVVMVMVGVSMIGFVVLVM